MLKNINVSKLKSHYGDQYKLYNLYYKEQLLTPFLTKKHYFTKNGIEFIKKSLISYIDYNFKKDAFKYAKSYLYNAYSMGALERTFIEENYLLFKIKCSSLKSFDGFVSNHDFDKKVFTLNFEDEDERFSQSYSVAQCLFAGLTYEPLNPNLISQMGYIIK